MVKVAISQILFSTLFLATLSQDIWNYNQNCIKIAVPMENVMLKIEKRSGLESETDPSWPQKWFLFGCFS